MSNPVDRVRRHGAIAACEFVSALRASFYAFQAAFIGKIDGLILADIEWQEGAPSRWRFPH